MSVGTKIYAALPVAAQHAAVTAYGFYWRWLRFGRGFSLYADEFRRREAFDSTQWNKWQREKLNELLAAAMRVPYYRQTWSAEQKRAAANGQLEGLPLLEKDPIRNDPRAFLRDDVHPLMRFTYHTSGTTGTPIATIWTIREIRRSLAVREARSAQWAGVSFAMPRATFSGRIVEPNPDSTGPFYRFNLAEKQVYLSPFHLRAETARKYVDAITKHNVQWLTGYAVSYYLLARHILEQGLDVPPLKAVITTSEKVTPEMRLTMETAYRCRVFEEYSTVESALFASECERGSLHVSPDAGIVEILRPDGTPCKPGEVGEVVATCLLRTYQMFIRYRLGDLAAWDDAPCSCGRALPVLREVVGRLEDVIIGPDGREMVRFHGIFVDQPNIREGQIIQEARDKIRVKVVATEKFGEDDVRDVVARVQQRLTSRVHVEVELVDAIPRAASGKYRAVVSLIAQDRQVVA